MPIVGQRDVRDREVEVRDRRNEDQRDQDERRALGAHGRLRGCVRTLHRAVVVDLFTRRSQTDSLV